MKWFSFSYVKQKPWLFAGIVIVFGVFFWFLLNRGASTSTVTTGGKSDAQVNAEAQLAMAGIAAGIQQGQTAAGLAAIHAQGDIAIALATMEAGYKIESLGVQREIAQLGIAAQVHAMDIAYQQSINNNSFQLDYATLAFDSAIAQTQIAAQVMSLSTLASQISTLKKGRRDDAFFALTSSFYNQPALIAKVYSPIPTAGGGSSGGGFFSGIGGILSPEAGLLT